MHHRAGFDGRILGSLQCRRTLVVLYQFLQGAGAMFAEYDLPEGEGGITWNNRKLEHYLNLQYRLVDEHPCVSNRTGPDLTHC